MKRICVFCGSNPGAKPVYVQAARELGNELAARGIGLVYGGATVGLMGEVARAVLAGGGEVIGVIPRPLASKEIAFTALADLRIVGSMHERKAAMADLADGFIALPGGLGTLEEFCEILTWGQLGIHRKPCGLLNAENYYAALLAFLDHGVKEGFIKPAHRGLAIVEDNIVRLLERLERFQPPSTSKWLDAANR
ncbi:MAG TPA: TIGR00730 family Rossman fold protein [Candidatus Binataceae bacterium]|nr:TIGR00730 family Rossman fold protein [Candidatus Binataceae bacterium]